MATPTDDPTNKTIDTPTDMPRDFKRRTLIKALAAGSLIPILGSNLIACSGGSNGEARPFWPGSIGSRITRSPIEPGIRRSIPFRHRVRSPAIRRRRPRRNWNRRSGARGFTAPSVACPPISGE